MSSSSSSFQQEEPLPPEEEIEEEKFSKEMEAKFMKDLENIEIGDSDSELESSSDFYEGLKKKITSQITTMREQESTTKNSIITELKATLTKEITNAEEFEEEIKEMKYLNTEAKSVINEEKILEIKSKLMAESGVNSRIMLAEDIVELRESQLRQEEGEREAIFEEVELEEEEVEGENNEIVRQEEEERIKGDKNNITKRSLMSKKTEKATTLLSSSNSKHKLLQFKKKPTLLVNTLNNQSNNKQIDNKIAKKLNEINLERERINMEREDDRSMRYEKECISQFFKERFIKFTIPKTETMKMPENIKFMKVTKPKSTFTNLEPLANNEKNVLPKNAPEIALKALKKTKRVSLKAASQTMVKIEFKKKDICEEGEEQRNSWFGGNKNLGVYIRNEEENPYEQCKNTEEQEQQYNRFTNILEPYIKQIEKPLRELQQISSVYKPKFIRNYLNENEKISNIAMVDDFDQEEQFEETGNNSSKNKKNNSKERSIEQILSFEDEVNENSSNKQESESEPQSTISKLKEFKLTFENVTSIKGIEKFVSVEYIALQYNQITKINELQLFVNNNNNLIELNLSNNLIKEAKPIEKLKELRYLNMANNKLREFQFYGGKLEILELKKNNIEVINELGENKYLRIVNLEENKLHDLIKGFKELYYLQELLLAKNYIESLEGIEKLLMLQTLDVSHNRLSKINHNLVYLFLNTLNLSYNQIEVVPNMFLPSLERFYLTNNKLTGESIKEKIYYLPELKELNLDDNQIKGFSTVWAFISYSKKLEIIKYDSNEYFLSVREKVRELYEAIIYKYMQNIKIINHNVYDTGIKAYYDSVYSSYLEKSETLFSTKGNLKNVEQFVSCLLEENKVIANLENKFSKLYHERFVEEEVFVKRKSISRAVMLEKVVGMLREGLGEGLGKGERLGDVNKNQANIGNNDKMSNKNNCAILLIINQIYFYHDLFQTNLIKKVHKIKSLFYKFKYKKEKRKKYFLKQKEKILKLFKPVEDMIFVNKLKQVINSFAKCIRVNRQLEAAIMIQKHWRGYKSRKLFKKLLKKLKHNVEDDDFELEEVDLDEFEEHEFPEFNFDLPEDINFDNYIIEPKYFELAQEKETKRRQSKHSTGEINNKNKKGLQQIEEQEEPEKEYNPMMNNFIKEEKVKEDKLKKKEQDEKLMKEWGFTNPATLEALRWKKKRKEEMKKKEAEENMTAAQRYERFKMLHK